MKPRKTEQIPQADIFRLRLDQILNQRHALYKLSGQIDWNAAEVNFGHLYSEEGRPGIPIRLMVGLMASPALWGRSRYFQRQALLH